MKLAEPKYQPIRELKRYRSVDLINLQINLWIYSVTNVSIEIADIGC